MSGYAGIGAAVFTSAIVRMTVVTSVVALPVQIIQRTVQDMTPLESSRSRMTFW